MRTFSRARVITSPSFAPKASSPSVRRWSSAPGTAPCSRSFEWRSEAAVEAAHANPRVQALWARYEACCDYITLADLAEAKSKFPHFELVVP
jgi:hypothetical protein